MTISILDGYAAAPGDISWEPFENIKDADGNPCEITIYDRTAPAEVVERAKDADMVIINKVVLSGDILAQLPRLKYVGVLATGYNVVDIDVAHERNIVVTNIPAYGTYSVAQMAMAHLLHITNDVAIHDAAVHDGKWSACPDFTFTLTPQMELAGKTFGVVGLGNTGSATACVANALGMKVLAFTSKSQEALPSYITKAASIEQLFSTADVVSLHCPLTPQTHHIINASSLSLMKSSAILLNTGRGPLVDEQALADALNAGRLYAAGIDVLTQEPPRNGSPLLTARNCHITPHIAWATLEARQRLMDIARDNVLAFIAGKPQNQV